MRKKKTYAMKRGGGVKPRMMKKGGAVKKMMKKGGAVKKFKPGGKVTASPAKMAGAAMGAGAAGMMAGMTVAKAKKFLAGKGFNVTKKTKGPR
jgi:hypothetical protein